VPYPCSLNVPSLQDAGPMGDQNPMAYVHKGGVRILSYLNSTACCPLQGPASSAACSSPPLCHSTPCRSDRLHRRAVPPSIFAKLPPRGLAACRRT
jgi:hypothetical protein